jgi:hypothetical protein
MTIKCKICLRKKTSLIGSHEEYIMKRRNICSSCYDFVCQNIDILEKSLLGDGCKRSRAKYYA